jgi:uncharacterized membrane protein
MTAGLAARLVFVDALRGVAILLMVQDHAFDWWLRGEFHATQWGRITEFLGTLAAPFFLFLLGTSLALSAQKRIQRAVPSGRLALTYLRRGVFLVLQGYALTWLTFYNGHNAAEMGAVDILHCLGLSTILMIPLVLARAWPLTLLATLAAAAVSPWAGGWALPHWLAAWLNGSGGISFFPLLPFLVYALAGLVLGQLYIHMSGHHHRVRYLMLALVAFGVGLFLLVPLIPAELGIRFPKPQTQAFTLALILWMSALAYALARWSRLLCPLTVLGQTAMMVYIAHHLLGFRLFYHFGWVTGHSWQGQYGIFDPLAACLLLVLLLGILYGLSKLWLIWRPRIGPAALVRRGAPALSEYW